MMNTSIFAAAAPALAILTQHATLGVRRRGATLRLKMPADSVSPKTEQDAVEQLIQAGARVRVLRRNIIWCPAISDGAVVWSKRRSRTDRATWTTVEVTL